MNPCRRHSGLAWGVGLGLGPAVACAAATNLVVDPMLPNAGLSVLRVLGGLVLVLALFFAGVWAFKNWTRLAKPAGRRPRLHVLESRPLGNRQGLHVVGYDRQRFLVASAPTGITLVSALPPAETEAAEAPVAPGFAAVLQEVLQRK
jgi:flagellar biogenesis protein FliO